MGQNVAPQAKGVANPALGRLLADKGPARRKTAEPVFLEALDEIIHLMEQAQDHKGWLDGSVSGVKWQEFMMQTGAELRDRLAYYREAGQEKDFCPASLSAFVEDRARIERAYIRDLVTLYKQAAMTYQALSG